MSDSSEVIDLLFFFFFTFITLLLKSSDSTNFAYISWQNYCFTSQICYDDLIFRKNIRFTDFFIFSQFWFAWKVWYDNFISRKFFLFPDFFQIFGKLKRKIVFLYLMAPSEPSGPPISDIIFRKVQKFHISKDNQIRAKANDFWRKWHNDIRVSIPSSSCLAS